MARTVSPAAVSSLAVPPVETISIPSSARPRAKSTIPVLSETDSSARWIRTSPGCVTAAGPSSGGTIASDDDAARVGGVERHRTAGDQPDRLGEQLVLDRLQRRVDGVRVGRVRQLDRALEDDRPAVDPLVDEVDRHAEDLDAIGERLADRADAGERGEQRGVDIDHALREPPQEAGRQQLHVARQDDELDLPG